MNQPSVPQGPDRFRADADAANRRQLVRRLSFHGVVGAFALAALVLGITGVQPVAAFVCLILAAFGIAGDWWYHRTAGQRP
jgi:Flp pilus assembly protein TadB